MSPHQNDKKQDVKTMALVRQAVTASIDAPLPAFTMSTPKEDEEPSAKSRRKRKATGVRTLSFFDNTKHDLAENFERMHKVTKTKTQSALAEILGVRQSSISDAKFRNSIPGEWYLKIAETYGVNPFWIRDGIGETYLLTSTVPPPERIHQLAGLISSTDPSIIISILLSKGLPKELANQVLKHLYIEVVEDVVLEPFLNHILPGSLAKRVNDEIDLKKIFSSPDRDIAE